MYGLVSLFIYFFINTREHSRTKKKNVNEFEIPNEMELDEIVVEQPAPPVMEIPVMDIFSEAIRVQPVDEPPPPTVDLDDVFRRIDDILRGISRDEQVSPPVINMVDLYAYEDLLDTDDDMPDAEMTDIEMESSDETMSQVYSPVVTDDELADNEMTDTDETDDEL